MAELRLNPYVPVMKKGDVYCFMGGNAQEAETVQLAAQPEDGRVRNLREISRAANMERLLAGEPVVRERLVRLMTEETVARMEARGWLVTELPDVSSIYSRSRAFCDRYLEPGAFGKLAEKSVMVLGCGGIGTHLAWHLATWGIGRLVLVDFDTVEESNLNRQLLFDRGDIGKKKIVVLKEKLLAINPALNIETVDCKVASEAQLEELCSRAKCDLIVKALDSPAEFPVWLDRVCRRQRQAYVAGITLQANALIGPTFLPGKSEVGWSDLAPMDLAVTRVHGTAPSLGLLLYHVSDELAVEAFKVLTGCGTLKYTGNLVMRNLFTGTEEVLGTRPTAPGNAPGRANASAPGQSARQTNPAAPGRQEALRPETAAMVRPDKALPLACVLVLGLALGGLVDWRLWLAAGAATLILPLYLYRKATLAVRATFLFGLILAAVLLFGGLRQWLAAAAAPIELAALLFFAFLGVSALLLLLCFLGTGLGRAARKTA